MRKLLVLIIISFSIAAHATSVDSERDEILMLLAYSVVFDDWQSEEDGNKRGYNIGAVLFDNVSLNIIGAQRNTTKVCDDKTQHAEVRLMQQCLNNECRGNGETRYLNETTIYTTLEPCMMCSGMMVFLNVKNAIYGQTDPLYGKNIERLKQSFNGIAAHDRAKQLSSIPSPFEERMNLDSIFKNYIEQTGNDDITAFLTTNEAKSVYASAKIKLLNMKVKHQENKAIYDQALGLLREINVETNICFIEHAAHS